MAVSLKALKDFWVRRVDAWRDLDWNEKPRCERRDCGERAEYVAGGHNGQCWIGWLFCYDHAHAFAKKTGCSWPPGYVPKDETND